MRNSIEKTMKQFMGQQIQIVNEIWKSIYEL